MPRRVLSCVATLMKLDQEGVQDTSTSFPSLRVILARCNDVFKFESRTIGRDVSGWALSSITASIKWYCLRGPSILKQWNHRFDSTI
ncbi:hypothetical protein AB1N83_010937 [Pleurotus pulmonarius]